jgi:hypothetical protein
MEVIVKQIRMSDCEDPDLFVSQPIYEWQQTDAGKFVMKHSKPEPMWLRSFDTNTYGYLYSIKAYLTPEEVTFFKLKFE